MAWNLSALTLYYNCTHNTLTPHYNFTITHHYNYTPNLVDMCIKVWRNLRTAFHKHLKINRTNYVHVHGYYPPKDFVGVSNWGYYNHLSFIASTFDSRKPRATKSLYTYINKYTHKYTHTHTHIYIYCYFSGFLLSYTLT